MSPKQMIPARISSPGRILQRELEERNWTQTDLAAITGRPVQAINEITQGSKQITPETALELAAAFDTSAEFWLNLESNYRLWLAQQNKGQSDIATRSSLYSRLPIREMQKRGWIEKTATASELERSILAFLGVRQLDQPIRMVANFRCSPGKEPDSPAKHAWLKRVEQLARARKSAPFDPERLEANMTELMQFAEDAENIAKIPDWLLKFGVKCVFVPHLPKTFIDGAAFYDGEDPVIALSLRYDRLDSFWFNICHEIGHILRGEGKSYLDVDLGNPELSAEIQENSEEKAANDFASKWLLDLKAYADFVRQTRPYFYAAKVIAFAKEQHRHPGIVVGRLQHDKILPATHLNGLRANVRMHLKDYIDA